MVTILSPGFTSPTRIEHDRVTSPLRCTEQAPHWAMPQPYLVPVRPTCSRITHRSGVSGSTCTTRTRPLMLSLAMSVPRKASCAANLLRSNADCWRGGGGESNHPRPAEHSARSGGLPIGLLRTAAVGGTETGQSKSCHYPFCRHSVLPKLAAYTNNDIIARWLSSRRHFTATRSTEFATFRTTFADKWDMNCTSCRRVKIQATGSHWP